MEKGDIVDIELLRRTSSINTEIRLCEIVDDQIVLKIADTTLKLKSLNGVESITRDTLNIDDDGVIIVKFAKMGFRSHTTIKVPKNEVEISGHLTVKLPKVNLPNDAEMTINGDKIRTICTVKPL